MGHPPPRFVRGRGDGTRVWFPLFAKGEKGEPKNRKSTALPPSAPLRACPVRLRSGQALSVVERGKLRRTPESGLYFQAISADIDSILEQGVVILTPRGLTYNEWPTDLQ